MTVSWDPLIMPEIYDRLVPTDSTSKWDFSLYRPDIVVVNLFQNDSWLVHLSDHPAKAPSQTLGQKRYGSSDRAF